MDRVSSRICSNHEGYPEKIEICNDPQAKTMIESKISPHIFKNHSDSSQMIRKIDKSLEKQMFFDDEILKIIRGMLLALSILFLCYYGPMQYSVLENGQILRGFSSRETIMTFSLGYSAWHSIISVIATGMLIYSIILKQPQFSLPLMGLFLAELVYDSCDAIEMVWYFFGYLRLQTALLYAAGIFLLILAEIWTWLGILRLYEYRNFQSY
ncbi:uncharacterized protein LOC115240103 isoform X1 [Formica exsecta]|uniref:uncharacterized protein LOC115240103 isoform X1 n=2 Tax=Formica exsecta TaxID=72781 RepID=UPI00114252CE|nr:uncharacterized protein LOC115240103 isoform X1 [Formica exsecta]